MRMPPARAALLAALVLTGVLHFLPWAHGPTRGGDDALYQTRDSASTWFSTLKGKANNQSYDSSATWFAAGDNGGVGPIRVGLMAVLGASVLGAFALFLHLRGVRPADRWLAASAGVLLLIATACYVVGLRTFLDAGMTWSFGPFVAAAAGIAFLLAASMTARRAAPPQPMQA